MSENQIKQKVVEGLEDALNNCMTLSSTRAMTDLSNITSAGKEVCAHNAMPSNKYIDLTLGASGTTYTAPADGYVSITGTSSWVDLVNLTNSDLGSCGAGRSGDEFSRRFVPLKKNDVSKVYFGDGFVKSSFRFYYAEGSK